jgi:uncharacterized membrane protein HdeD (DUF308 family)
MSRAFTVAIVCGIVVAVSGLIAIIAGVMAGSWPMSVTGALSAVSGTVMWVFGSIGKKQSGAAS